MVALSNADATVVASLRHEFETMGEFYPEGGNSAVTVDPAAVIERSADEERRDSIFYSPVMGRFMDWGFSLSCRLLDPFPQEAAHVVSELTPYATLVVERLLQTWAEVDFESYHPDDDVWVSGSVTDAAAAKRAREQYAELYGEQPPDSYYLSLIEADEEVMDIDMKVYSGTYDSADAFRQRCRERETALYHIDTTDPELIQLY